MHMGLGCCRFKNQWMWDGLLKKQVYSVLKFTPAYMEAKCIFFVSKCLFSKYTACSFHDFSPSSSRSLVCSFAWSSRYVLWTSLYPYFLAQVDCAISLDELQNYGKISELICCVCFLLFYFIFALIFIKTSFLKLLLPHWSIEQTK